MTNTEKEIAFDSIAEIIKNYREELQELANGSVYSQRCAARNAFCDILRVFTVYENKQ